jgi:hypothetical protein
MVGYLADSKLENIWQEAILVNCGVPSVKIKIIFPNVLTFHHSHESTRQNECKPAVTSNSKSRKVK